MQAPLARHAMSTKALPEAETDTVIRPAAFTPATGRPSGGGFKFRPSFFIIGTLLVICAVSALYLLTAKSVYIASTPKEAVVKLSDGFHIQLADHYLIHPGEVTLNITAPGYYPLKQPLIVTPEQNQTHQFNLKKLPGYLTVKTQPETTGEVFIDGELIGESDKKLYPIPPGSHNLTLKSHRFKEYQQPVNIEGKETHQIITATLEPAWADVNLNSKPRGAEILVDDQPVGETPFTAEILEGERVVTLSLPGYKSWRKSLEVEAGKAIDLPEVTLEKADGSVALNSSPANASVTINGEYKGQTPLNVALPPGKTYTITLFKDGFQSAKESLKIASDKKHELNIKLKAQLGSIHINSQPEDALVYIDGRLMGRSGNSFSLPARQHLITLKKKGFVDYQTQALPRPGLEQTINAQLKTPEQAKWASIKPMIKTTAGQTLKLFKPKDSFTMGASRREQGRRANEALRKVTLNRPFYLGLKEVTNAQFRRFSQFHSSGHVKSNSLNNDNNPVVNITWQQAAAYCNWLSEQEKLTPFYVVGDKDSISRFNNQADGYRLPTEAEWAWAARFESSRMKKYPWGEKLPPTPKSGNYADRNAAPLLGNILTEYDDGYAVSAPVGSFSANKKGIYDLGGNVAEWINDFYGISSGITMKTQIDPLGPAEGDYHVIRGSSWAHGTVTDLRLSFRDYGTEARNDLGFRLARFVD